MPSFFIYAKIKGFQFKQEEKMILRKTFRSLALLRAMKISKHGLLLSLFLSLFACSQEETIVEKVEPQVGERPYNSVVDQSLISDLKTLDSIRSRGKLIALTRYDANTYFLYKGQEMGFEYELLKRFSDFLGVALELKTPKHWDSLFVMLERGEGDLIAANLTVTMERARELRFARHHTTTQQVLIQKKPSNWRKLKKHQLKKKLLRSQLSLINKTVHVRKSSSFADRLMNLSEEMGGKILLEYVDEAVETGELIRKVSQGEIEYTIADENLAKIYASYYPNIDVKTPVSFPQRVAWAMAPGSKDLAEQVNIWFRGFKRGLNPEYNMIYKKYYKSKKAFKIRKESDYSSLVGGKISPFDDLFKRFETPDYDWKLLAALAYQESRFDPNVESWMGAVGLMQLLPNTAKDLGIDSLHINSENVRASVLYLKFIHKHFWQDLPQDQALFFILASYNAGVGHIKDAQRLAKLMGYDPNTWVGGVDQVIKLLSQEKYYSKPEVKHGYMRGEEPFDYVQEIMWRYKVYKKHIIAPVVEKDPLTKL